jgi:hypothetical protein
MFYNTLPKLEIIRVFACIKQHSSLLILEVTIARKVLPHPQGSKGSMHNLQHELHLWIYYMSKLNTSEFIIIIFKIFRKIVFKKVLKKF